MAAGESGGVAFSARFFGSFMTDRSVERRILAQLAPKRYRFGNVLE